MKRFPLFLLAPLFFGVMSSLLAFPMEEETSRETEQNHSFSTCAATRAGADEELQRIFQAKLTNNF